MSSPTGHKWTDDEHARFLEAMELYPRGPWKQRAAHVGTRTTRQVMTHAQKITLKTERHARGLQKAGRPRRASEQRSPADTTQQKIPTPRREPFDQEPPATPESVTTVADTLPWVGETCSFVDMLRDNVGRLEMAPYASLDECTCPPNSPVSPGTDLFGLGTIGGVPDLDDIDWDSIVSVVIV